MHQTNKTVMDIDDAFTINPNKYFNYPLAIVHKMKVLHEKVFFLNNFLESCGLQLLQCSAICNSLDFVYVITCVVSNKRAYSSQMLPVT